MRKKFTLKALSAAITVAMVGTALPIGITKVSAAELSVPVISYDFEKSEATGLKFGGEAKVTELEGNGVLQLSTQPTQGVTYAQFAEDVFTSTDFTKGATFTAKIYVTGYVGDWTPIFMLGTGTLGSESGNEVSYHLTQGWSTQVRLGGDNITIEKYGSEVLAPYTWDYFSNAENQNKWYTLTTTISPTDLKVYIDGVEVLAQKSAEATGGSTAYSDFLSSLSKCTGNYLGASYWGGDTDFQGYMDNVAIFNSALTAEQVTALSTDFPGSANDTPSDDTNTGNTTPDNTTPPDSTDTPSDSIDGDTPPTDSTDTDTPPADSTDTDTPSDNIAPAPDNTIGGDVPTGDTDTSSNVDDTDTGDDDSDEGDDDEEEAPAPTLKKKATVKVGKTVKLKVKNAEGTVKWSSSKKSVATVNKNGKVKGIKKGTATIKAKVDGETLKCKVTVKK